MNREQTYITDGEKINCQKVADAFAGQFDSEDLIILNAGRYGFVKLQYFKFPFGFDTADSFYDCKNLFDELWGEWLHTQLIRLSADTPMADMDFADILKCLPEEKQKELLEKQLYFAEKTGVKDILEKTAPDLWSEEYMKTIKTWSRDWAHFDWTQIHENLCGVEEKRREGKPVDTAEIGITLDELKEYFEWLYDTHPNTYSKLILYMALVQAGISPDEAAEWSDHPAELEKALDELSKKSDNRGRHGKGKE